MNAQQTRAAKLTALATALMMVFAIAACGIAGDSRTLSGANGTAPQSNTVTERNTQPQNENVPVSPDTQIPKSKTEAAQSVSYSLPGMEKYPWSFSIFIAYAARELSFEWEDVRSFLTEAGYQLWFPSDEEEEGGWMLLSNGDDEQGWYYELATLFGGMAEKDKKLDYLMYQFNIEFDCVIVELSDKGDRYIIRDCTFEDGETDREWEVETLEELIEYAIGALDKVYDESFIS